MTPLEDERESWNQRYRRGSHLSLVPDPLLPEAYREFIAPLFPRRGRALDVAGGVGRHAIWLAERGWKVTLVDISEVGIAAARKNAAAAGVRLQCQAADLKSYRPGRQRFDLVLVFFYLQRELFPALSAALKPGGLLVYKTYTREHRKFGGGPSHPAYFLKPGELLHAFSRLQVVHYRETVRDRGVAELVARKN